MCWLWKETLMIERYEGNLGYSSYVSKLPESFASWKWFIPCDCSECCISGKFACFKFVET